jgi:hypothetical protein
MSTSGYCAICGEWIRSGPIVIAEVVDGEVNSHAHAQCWVDSGRVVIGPKEIRLMLGAAALPVFEETQPADHVRDAARANQ